VRAANVSGWTGPPFFPTAWQARPFVLAWAHPGFPPWPWVALGLAVNFCPAEPLNTTQRF